MLAWIYHDCSFQTRWIVLIVSVVDLVMLARIMCTLEGLLGVFLSVFYNFFYKLCAIYFCSIRCWDWIHLQQIKCIELVHSVESFCTTNLSTNLVMRHTRSLVGFLASSYEQGTFYLYLGEHLSWRKLYHSTNWSTGSCPTSMDSSNRGKGDFATLESQEILQIQPFPWFSS